MNIIDKIDAVTGCQRCGKPLGNSPSDDFCSETCQHLWHAGHAEPLLIEPAPIHPACRSQLPIPQLPMPPHGLDALAYSLRGLGTVAQYLGEVLRRSGPS